MSHGPARARRAVVTRPRLRILCNCIATDNTQCRFEQGRCKVESIRLARDDSWLNEFCRIMYLPIQRPLYTQPKAKNHPRDLHILVSTHHHHQASTANTFPSWHRNDPRESYKRSHRRLTRLTMSERCDESMQFARFNIIAGYIRGIVRTRALL